MKREVGNSGGRVIDSHERRDGTKCSAESYLNIDLSTINTIALETIRLYGLFMQQTFFGQAVKEFGGSLSKGKRKERRPLVTKRPLHVVFRSTHEGGADSFCLPSRRKIIQRCLQLELSLRAIRIYRFSINSNHIHMLIRGKSRQDIQAFLRSFPGRVAMLLNRAAKGRPLSQRFWIPVYTRIVEWGRDFKRVVSYVLRNELEAAGVIAYVARKGPKSNRGQSNPHRSGPRLRLKKQQDEFYVA